MDQIIAYLKNVFTPKEQSVLGVDIGSSSIKVVQIRKKRGKAILETYGEIALGPYALFEIGQATALPPEKLAEALKDLIKEAKVTTKNAGFSIPIRSSLVTIMELPTVSEKELVTMIPLEARKYIPVPISEVKLDWSIIPESDQVETDVPDDQVALRNEEDSKKETKEKVPKIHALVVAIHNDTLQNFSTIVSAADVTSTFFEIEIFSAVRSVLEQDVRPVMVIDIGAATTKLYIIERGIVRNSHIINRGGQDITLSISKSMGIHVERAEKLKRNVGSNLQTEDVRIRELAGLVMDYIFSEANSVILNYQKNANKNIVKIILTGGGSSFEGIAEKAFGYFKIETVYGAPFNKVQSPAFLEEVLRFTGRGFAVAVGVALRKLQEIE